jgi:hypothetical protein
MKTYHIIADDIYCYSVETNDIQFEMQCAKDKRKDSEIWAHDDEMNYFHL